jgi:hypothetical protein
MDADLGLSPTEEFSSLLGPDGRPLRYQSKKLGYVGFLQLKERP